MKWDMEGLMLNAYKAVKFAHSQNITSSNVGGNYIFANGGLQGIPVWVLINSSCPTVAAGTYRALRVKMFKDVTFSYSSAPSLVVSANGFSMGNPNDGTFWAQAINITNTTARLRTYFYRIESIATGQVIGWVPSDPFNGAGAQFNYSVIDNVTPNIFLQNEVVSSGTQNHKAINEILVGRNVTSSKPQGDYIVQGTANVTLKAGNQITFEPGTIISPSQGGYFEASIEPFFTCSQYPMGRMANSNSSNDEEKNNYQEPFLKNYNVSFKETEKVLVDEKIELKVYPNPSINNSTIEYSLPNPSKVVISIYDVKGTELVKLNNRNIHESGRYKINLELSDYPSGIYIVKMTTNQGVISNQLIKQ